MKTKLCLFIAIFFGIAMYSQTIIPAGPISGTWTLDGSPYRIFGETTIPNDSTLSIEPGVLVEWQGSYTMHVQGQIVAIGTETDSIIFTAKDREEGFNSIRFLDTPSGNDTSWFVYCAIRYGKAHGMFPDNCGGAIAAQRFDKIVIDHCLFAYNEATEVNLVSPGGGAIALWTSSPEITNSKFINNESLGGGAINCYMQSLPAIEGNLFTSNTSTGDGGGGAIFCYINSDPEIKYNTFSNNLAKYGGAISCIDTCSPTIDHNLFYENSSGVDGGAISLYINCSPELINNTIAGNQADARGGGLYMYQGCDPKIKNTILWGNTANEGNQVYIETTDCAPEFYYSNIEGGQEAFGGVGLPAVYLNNIDSAPLFEYVPSGSCYLYENSPCIDKGHPLMTDPDDSRCDIGAYYFDHRLITALEATDITQSSFVANWEEAEGAISYLLDVSIDPDFNSFVEGFQNLDVGNVDYFLVEGLEPLIDYYYRVRANYYFGRSDYSNTITFLLTSFTDTEYNSSSVKIFPNPFTTSSTFEYVLTHKATVRIEVFNVSGKMVQELCNAEKDRGVHQLNWNTNSLQNGIYFIRLQAGSRVVTKRVVKL